MIVRAEHKHLDAIDEIYNQAIEDGLRTAHLKPLSKQQRLKWFKDHTGEPYPIFVWTEQDHVLGWLSVSPYRAGRNALKDVAEISYYVDYNHHGKGIASKLMQHGISFCKEQGFRILVAIMISGNEASAGLAEKFGFKESGRIKHALRFENTLRDHVYMSLELS